MARSYPTHAHKLCAVCSKLVAEWGVGPPISPIGRYGGVRPWSSPPFDDVSIRCSWCFRNTHQELYEKKVSATMGSVAGVAVFSPEIIPIVYHRKRRIWMRGVPWKDEQMQEMQNGAYQSASLINFDSEALTLLIKAFTRSYEGYGDNFCALCNQYIT